MLRAFVLQPSIVFQAEVASNPVDSAYPVDQLTFDNVSIGSFSVIQVGQLVSFGTPSLPFEHGVQRIRKPATADTIYIGRTSKGYGYGEIGPIGTSVIRVWNVRTVWTKPYFEDVDTSASPPVSVHFKDGDIAYSDQTSQPPPVSNCGVGTMATIDGSNIITVEFDGTDSFAVADGATISTYLWDVDDGTIITGTSASDTITATFPAGFRYVSLTVTDSNGKTHVSYCPVFARNPASDATIPIDGLSIRVTQEGQEATVQLSRPLPEATYPDNTLVMAAFGEPSSASDRSHIEFIGWHHRDSADHSAERTGYVTGASLTCLDVAGKMAAVHGFSQKISHADTPSHWGEMATANMDKFMHYLLQWHSNVLDVADWTWSGTGSTYALYGRGANPGTLWDQVQEQADEMNPTYKLTCDRLGRLSVIVDPQHQSGLTRTSTVQTAISESEWTAIRYDHERYPRYFWLWGGAAIAANDLNADGEIDTVFCVAPGTAPGIGYTEMRDEVGLTPSQVLLNTTTGHRYARMNAPERPFRITLTGGNDHGIEPAHMTWVQLILGQSMSSAPRGLSLSAVRGLPLELTLRWNVTRTGVVKSAELLWEREITGADAVTVLPESNSNEVETGLPDGYQDYTPGDIVVSDPILFYGDPQMYILWDGAHVMRTDNIMDSSPTWELVDTGITGTILDGQYAVVDSSTAGMWLMTTTAIWWCADIMATTPVWNAVLTLATVQANDATPPTDSVEFKSMFNAQDASTGFLIVATGWTEVQVANAYAHAYFWHTHDYGQNWTQVDMNGFLYTNSGIERGYTNCGLHGINVHRSSGVITAARITPRVGTQGRTAIFVSDDFGDTWVKNFEIASSSDDEDSGALLDAFPDIAGPGWMMRGNTFVAVQPVLYKSNDGVWSSAANLPLPSGYDYVSGVWRPNSRPDDPDHLIAWHHHVANNDMELLETLDGGATWSTVFDSNLITASNSRAQHNTPNGWPVQPDTWILIRAVGSIGDPVIAITLDNFQNVASREGNLSTLLSATWVNGYGSGFCLPRVGENA